MIAGLVGAVLLVTLTPIAAIADCAVYLMTPPRKSGKVDTHSFSTWSQVGSYDGVKACEKEKDKLFAQSMTLDPTTGHYEPTLESMYWIASLCITPTDPRLAR